MSTLVTNTITGLTTATSVTMPTTTKIGATAIVSASAGSATIIAEGGTNTTNIQQGLSKAWINFNGTGTAAISDSYNMDSITDLATGMFKVDLTTAMGNDDYSMTATMNHHVIREDNNDNRTTTAFWLQCYDHNTSPIDVSRVSTVVTGDLA